MFFRVKWTTTTQTETESHEYLASAKDAWTLWHWLTTRSTMEPEYHKKMVDEGQESAIFATIYVPPVTTIKVYDLEGNEVVPEQGLSGMFRHKETNDEP